MPEKLSLENIGDGSAVILFNRELAKVLANIVDENTNTKARKISLVVKITPMEIDRKEATIEIECVSKLSQVRPFETKVKINAEGLEVVAHEPEPQQLQLIKTGRNHGA
jgi:hypothetical protein